MHFTPGILVFEKQTRWEGELKREFATDRIRVRAVRAVQKIPPLLDMMPGSVVVLDLDAAPADCLRLIGSVMEMATPFVIAISSQSLEELEWPARELGATAVLPQTVTGEYLSRLCRRMLGTVAGGQYSVVSAETKQSLTY